MEYGEQMKVLFATNNKDKLTQAKTYFGENNVVGQKEYGIDMDVEENGKTFEENAIIKAKAIGEITNEIVIADDSGLEISEYNGWPGVYTHRFLGENSTTKERNDYILEKMKDLPYDKRKCTIKCVIALYYNGDIKTFTGEYHSHILKEKVGDNNFGFDEIVEVANGKSFASLTNEEKLKINARGLALKQASEYLKSLQK